MSTPVRLGAALVALVGVFALALGAGAWFGPDLAPAETAGHAGMISEEGGHAAMATELPGGLQSSEQGYTLRVVSTPRAGAGRPLSFVVDGPDGAPVTAYDSVHERALHLIKVGRDGAGYEHVHPVLAADGTWTARLTLAPGSSRLIADFTPTGGPALVLGTDVEVSGEYVARPATPVARTARVDGYRVTLTGDLQPGAASPLTATITRDGDPVTDLQPYLGAFGHLVALREGDLAYLHVHPVEADAGPAIPFVAEVPSAGRYRLFLDFRHGGQVHTADFTLEAGADEHADH